MSANKTTAENASSSQPTGQHTGKLDGILNKAGGLGNILHGTGKIIHGHVPGSGDPAQGGKTAIVTAGRQEVERGLDRIDGKPTGTSANGHTHRPVGAEPAPSPTPLGSKQVPTATPRAGPTSQEARGVAGDIEDPANSGAAGTGTRGHGPVPEQHHYDDERTQAAQAASTTPPHDHPIVANGSGIQHDTDMRQQGDGTVAGDQERLDRETAATALHSDHPVVSDSPGPQSEVQGNEPADGTSVSDEQTHTTTDTSDPANAVAEGHDRPGASGSPGIQSDTDIRQQGSGSTAGDQDRPDIDVHQQGNGTVSGDQERLNEETEVTASPSDHPTVADRLGDQHNTNVLQQVQGSVPGAGTIRDEQNHTTTDASDPANAVAEGHGRPDASGTPGVQSDTDIRKQGSGSTPGDKDRPDRETVPTALLSDRLMVSNSPRARSDIDVHQQGNRTVTGDQERLNEETEVTESPGDHPTVVDNLGAQRDTDVLQQVEGSLPGAGVVHDEQSHTTTDASDPPNAVTEGHDRPGASGSPGVQNNTSIRKQGSGSTEGDQDRPDRETVPTSLLSDRPMVSNSPGARSDIDVHQQGNRTVTGDQERLNEETEVAVSPGDQPTVQGTEPAAGKSVGDEQTPITADTSDPANAVAEGHDRPGASGSPGIQSDTDIRQKGNGLIGGDQDKPDRETAVIASPSDRSTVADDPGAQHDTDVRQQVQGIVSAQDKLNRESAAKASTSASDRSTAAGSPSAQRDTDILQQVQGIGPATTGTSVRDEQTHAATDASDPNNAAAGRHDRPSISGSPDVRSNPDLRQQGNGSIAGDQDKLDRETPATASPGDRDRPTVGNDLGAQRDSDVLQHEEIGPAAGTPRDEQTRTTTGASDPANVVTGRHGHHGPATEGSPGVQGDTNVRQQGDGTVVGDEDKFNGETAATAFTSAADRPTVAGSVPDKQIIADASDHTNAAAAEGHDHPATSGSPGVPGDSDTDVRQQGNGFTSSDRVKAQDSRTTADTSDPVIITAGQERPFGTAPQA